MAAWRHGAYARRVITHRYGLDGGEPKPLGEAGAEVGTAREGARRLISRAHGNLRRSQIGEAPGNTGEQRSRITGAQAVAEQGGT